MRITTETMRARRSLHEEERAILLRGLVEKLGNTPVWAVEMESPGLHGYAGIRDGEIYVEVPIVSGKTIPLAQVNDLFRAHRKLKTVIRKNVKTPSPIPTPELPKPGENVFILPENFRHDVDPSTGDVLYDSPVMIWYKSRRLLGRVLTSGNGYFTVELHQPQEVMDYERTTAKEYYHGFTIGDIIPLSTHLIFGMTPSGMQAINLTPLTRQELIQAKVGNFTTELPIEYRLTWTGEKWSTGLYDSYLYEVEKS
jgi:hypothetical protein